MIRPYPFSRPEICRTSPSFHETPSRNGHCADTVSVPTSQHGLRLTSDKGPPPCPSCWTTLSVRAQRRTCWTAPRSHWEPPTAIIRRMRVSRVHVRRWRLPPFAIAHKSRQLHARTRANTRIGASTHACFEANTHIHTHTRACIHAARQCKFKHSSRV